MQLPSVCVCVCEVIFYSHDARKHWPVCETKVLFQTGQWVCVKTLRPQGIGVVPSSTATNKQQVGLSLNEGPK